MAEACDNDWIDLGDRRPEPRRHVLIAGVGRHGPFACEAWYQDGQPPGYEGRDLCRFGWVVRGGLGWIPVDSATVTHWREIPTPPAGPAEMGNGRPTDCEPTILLSEYDAKVEAFARLAEGRRGA